MPRPTRRQFIAGSAAAGLVCLPGGYAALADNDPMWEVLATEPYRGKQDDIAFVSPTTGFYGNGEGKLYRTDNGGETWENIWTQPGTFIRALGFRDEKTGFLGNIGTGYFPGVTDPKPLYRTDDGGLSWQPVTAVEGPAVTGICAINITGEGGDCHIRAGGRVGTPGHMMTSRDGGDTWVAEDLSGRTDMILDIHFTSLTTGFIAGAVVDENGTPTAVVLRTQDGGANWNEVYRSTTGLDNTWKLSFPTEQVGYVTIQTHQGGEGPFMRLARTLDGGSTWQEMAVHDEPAWRPFGVLFLDADHGFVGGHPGSFETLDGGKNWQPCNMGTAVNKIRLVADDTGGRTVFAIGVQVRRLRLA